MGWGAFARLIELNEGSYAQVVTTSLPLFIRHQTVGGVNIPTKHSIKATATATVRSLIHCTVHTNQVSPSFRDKGCTPIPAYSYSSSCSCCFSDRQSVRNSKQHTIGVRVRVRCVPEEHNADDKLEDDLIGRTTRPGVQFSVQYNTKDT